MSDFNFKLIYNYLDGDIRQSIRFCQLNNHVQQVAYSTYHDAITQVCFTCNELRTSMKGADINR